MTIRRNLESIISQIRAASHSAGRDSSEIILVAVSKKQSVQAMNDYNTAARELGRLVIFGENYVQEFIAKQPHLQPYHEVHLIGPLQSNKVRDAVAAFDVIQSVHSEKILSIIYKEAKRSRKQQRIMLQVNISNDDAKSGFSEAALKEMWPSLASLQDHVLVEGLMTITAHYNDPTRAHDDYRKMRLIKDALGVAKLSMGMSGDYTVAIEEGADMVRIGTALFGDRQ